MLAPVPALAGFATPHATFDFETYSEAGYVWVDVPGYTRVLAGKWVPNKYKRKPPLNAILDASGTWVWKPEQHIQVLPTKALESLPGASKKGLQAVGVRNYVLHPTFRVLCLAYDLLDGHGMRQWIPGMPPPWDLLQYVVRREILEAWNVGFEWDVWQEYCVPVLGWPALDWNQMRCCMAKAAASKYPRALENAGVVLKLKEQKDPAGKALIKKLTVPRAPTLGNPAPFLTPESNPEDFAKFYAYNAQDVRSEMEASLKIPDLAPRELIIWRMDQIVNKRGMYLDRKAIADCIVIVEQAYEKYHAELRSITNKAVKASTEVQPTLRWMVSQGVYLPNLDEETVEEALRKPYPAAVLRVLKIRQTLAFGSVRKLFAMRTQVCADGRLRDQYAFAAAQTDLWNGQGVQPANLYKGKLDKPEKVERALSIIAMGVLELVEYHYGDALECVADCLRSMIVAAPGHRLMSADFTAIQAVVTAALAGESWVLDVFRTHGKIYEATASMITGTPLQIYLDYRKREGKHHADRQPYGKIAFLSSGFGGWIGAWKKFGAEEYMTDEQIKQAILKWRAASPNIVELWGGQTRGRFTGNEYPQLYGLEGAAIAAVQYPGKCFGYRGIRYQMHGDVLYCQPPGTGTPLVYHSPRLGPPTQSWAQPWELSLTYMSWDSKRGWSESPLYGGVHTQNVVAKVSREFQADALVRLENAGYPIVMHTHDEQVAEVSNADTDKTIDKFLAIVNDHDWANRTGGEIWPIRAPAAEETQRYGKWE